MMSKRLFVAATLVLSVGCLADVEDDLGDSELKLSEQEVIINNLVDAGFPEDDIMVDEDGRVIVGRDAVVTLQASREMAGIVSDVEDANDFRQYRTENMVNTAVVSNICVVADNAFLSDALSLQALDNAIAAYNAESLDISYGRDGVGCNAGTADAIINAHIDNSGGGVAGFPSGGLPYHEFFIGGSIASSYGVPVAQHVIMHEMGHCIGFRHSDYYNRSISCGGAPTDEGDGGVGAIFIEGTDATAVLYGSVMNSCYSVNSNGVWTSSDQDALQCLYGTGVTAAGVACAPPPPPTYDISVDSQTNQSAGKRVKTYYGPYDASTYSAMRFTTTGPNGDADLYVRQGANPTTNNYDCRSAGATSNEVCEISPASGDYYVMIMAYNAYSGLTFEVDASN